MTDINKRDLNLDSPGKTGKSAKQKNHAGQNCENLEKESASQSYQADSSDYSAIIGRSQVNFKGKSDSVETDMKMFADNPVLTRKADNLFEAAYAAQKDEKDAYAKACQVAHDFRKEFD